MQYDEIMKTIITSSSEDWATVSAEGATFLDRLGEARSADQRWVEVASHTSLVVYKADIDLRLAWGLPNGDHLAYEGWTFPDPRIDRIFVDAFWRGALVARWPVLMVDGYRCYLPEPEWKASGWTVKASETALARLVQHLSHSPGWDFDEYLKRTGAIEVPD